MRQLYDSRNELYDNSNESHVRLEELCDLVNRFILTWRDTCVQGLIDNQGETPESVPVCVGKAAIRAKSDDLWINAGGFGGPFELTEMRKSGVSHTVSHTPVLIVPPCASFWPPGSLASLEMSLTPLPMRRRFLLSPNMQEI